MFRGPSVYRSATHSIRSVGERPMPRRGLSGQFVGQLEQQGTGWANGFVFVGNQNFAADAGECAEKGGRLWDGIGSEIQVVIKKEKGLVF